MGLKKPNPARWFRPEVQSYANILNRETLSGAYHPSFDRRGAGYAVWVQTKWNRMVLVWEVEGGWVHEVTSWPIGGQPPRLQTMVERHRNQVSLLEGMDREVQEREWAQREAEEQAIHDSVERGKHLRKKAYTQGYRGDAEVESMLRSYATGNGGA